MYRINPHQAWLFVASAGAFVTAAAWAAADDEFTWKGGSGLSWSTPQNWEPTGAPGHEPHLGANAMALNEPSGEIQLSSAATLGQLIIQTPLVIWGTTVSAGKAEVSNLRLHNAVFYVGDLTFNDTNQWNWAAVDGPFGSPARNTGTLLFLTGGNKELKSKKFTNEATVEHVGSPLNIMNGAEVINEGQWNLWNAGGLHNSAGTGLFKNKGTLTRHPGDPPGASAASEVKVPFKNEGGGTVDVIGPNTTLLFQGGGEVAETYNVTNAGRIRFLPQNVANAYEVESSANFGGAGEVLISSGPFEVQPGATLTSNVHMVGLHLQNASAHPTLIHGTLHNQGVMKWSTGLLGGVGEIRNSGAFLLAGGSPLEAKVTNDGGSVIQVFNTFVGSNIEIKNEPGAMWQLNGGHLLRSSGSSGSKFTNRGLLRRGGPGDQSDLQMLDFGLPLILEPGAVVEALISKLKLTAGGELSGGRFETNGPVAEIHLDGGQGFPELYTVKGAVENKGEYPYGTMVIGPWARLHMEGGKFTSHDSLRVEGVITSVAGGGALTNKGHVVLSSGFRIGTSSNPWGTVENEGVCLVASGNVHGMIRNKNLVEQYGTVALHGGEIENLQSKTWHLRGNVDGVGTFTNAGILVQDGIGDVWTGPSVVFDNKGLVFVDSALLTIANCAQVSNGVLSGGYWKVTAPGRLHVGQGITAMGPGTKVVLDGSDTWNNFTPEQLAENTNLKISDLAIALSTLFNEGTLELDAGGSVNTQDSVNNNGTVQIAPGGKLNSQGPVNNNSGPAGSGKIEQGTSSSESGDDEPMITAPALNNAGVLHPGGASAAGVFNLTGNLVQLPDGEIHIEIGGTAPMYEHDQVRVYNGTASLAGTLIVDVLPGYAPIVGHSYNILILPGATSGVLGAFEAIQLPQGMNFTVEYQPDQVVLTFDGYQPQCAAADLNCDGVVGVADLLLLLSAWGPCANCSGRTCSADLDENCAVGITDLLMLLSSWG